jgi:hypothetical protein
MKDTNYGTLHYVTVIIMSLCSVVCLLLALRFESQNLAKNMFGNVYSTTPFRRYYINKCNEDIREELRTPYINTL